MSTTMRQRVERGLLGYDPVDRRSTAWAVAAALVTLAVGLIVDAVRVPLVVGFIVQTGAIFNDRPKRSLIAAAVTLLVAAVVLLV